MAITVYVWETGSNGVGHVSMLVNTTTYVSWWPSELRKDRAWAATLENDRHMEGSYPHWASDPITSLDEKAIERWWIKMAGSPALEDQQVGGRFTQPAQGSYGLWTRNCAHVVAEGLIEGGLLKNPAAASVYHSMVIGPLTPGRIREIVMALTSGHGIRGIERFQDPQQQARYESRRYGGL